ncbi:hypothetical protein [Pedococcus dokdonensis]|uniref:hypothetical protein n=1 Tax=Pedococcus dokdonensis TaxID=443156 RepID=UPI000B8A13C0|nr:hypothetical protein [Pedococcus dokdonensis]
MIHVGILPRHQLARWTRTRHAAYQRRTASGAQLEPLPRKDFSAIPVCGSVRPSSSQRRLADRA